MQAFYVNGVCAGSKSFTIVPFQRLRWTRNRPSVALSSCYAFKSMRGMNSPVRGLIKPTGEINPTVRELINPRGNINRPIRGLIIFLSLLLKAACARRLLGNFGTPFFVHSFEIEREGEELCASRAHRFHIRQHLMVFQGAAPLAVEHVQQAEHEFEFGLHFEEGQVGIAA